MVELARASALWLFALGYFNLTALAKLVAAHAYFLSRLHPQTTRREVGGGRRQVLDVAKALALESCPVVEKALVRGADECVPARRIAVRMPAAIGHERRRQASAVAKNRGSTPSQTPLSLMAWKLFITHGPATVWPPKSVGIAYSLRWQIDLGVRAWKSGVQLATLTTTTKHRTLW